MLVFLSAFYYNADVALKAIAAVGGAATLKGVLSKVFGILADIEQNIRSVFGKKLYVLGLSSLLAISGRPEFASILGPIVPQAFMKTAQLCHSIHKQQQGGDDEDEDEDDGEDGEGARDADGENAEIDDDEDAMGSDFDNYEDFMLEDEDPDEYETPIDNVNEKQYFLQALKAGGTPQIRELASKLTPAQMAFLRE